MEDNQTVNVNSPAEPEEISDCFLCCICLDLLYKPIVLSCGHISCFWCVHKSMSNLRASHCPICRQPYNHFPAICAVLHRLLLKMYPIAYKMREKQILEDEKKSGFFSPQIDSHARGPLFDNEFDNLGNSMHSPTVCESTTKAGNHENMKQLEPPSFVLNNEECKQISIADVLCTACKQLLIHPLVLNCGHAYCETCIIRPTAEQLKCEVCQCLNPNGYPKVCLELDHFLEKQFCKEYALRKSTVQLKKVQLKHESATAYSKEGGKSGFIFSPFPSGENSSWWADPHSKVHVGVGCDSCGMYPIIGDRYQCKDCVEASGFDLCGDCYNTSSKLPGRFNQQHTPEHRLELVKKNIFCDMMMRFVTGRVEDVSAIEIANDVLENESPVTLPSDAEENTDDDHMIDQNNTESTN